MNLDRYHYLLLMAGCVAITLPLEFLLRARVYRQPRRLWRAMWPMLLVFLAWDYLGYKRGHWHYSPTWTTGWTLPFGMPVEELVFFLVIPICGLLTYEAVGTVLAALRRPTGGAARSGPGRGHA